MNSHIDKKLFSSQGQALEQHCPDCGAELQVRHGKHGAFLGCMNYPECDFIKPLHQPTGQIIKALGVPCPECASELVLRQGRYGMFIGCESYPACHYIAHTEHESAQQLFSCPVCNKGSLVERVSRYGKQFYACDSYPKCDYALNSEPIAGECKQCGFKLLTKKKNTVVCADRKCQALQE
ncbi:DNA topoisomerase family protein [Vibrio gallicus]|uniref:DNA topoisomerase family protein n=1 Tax=Vibrio gallicus TaxID=190897 RepID=UPI0021C3B4BF|nr:topoisomerase DNA-binding C4 zinc finger domain-containing protein [Vibrio gallicus]